MKKIFFQSNTFKKTHKHVCVKTVVKTVVFQRPEIIIYYLINLTHNN